jgi:hypothetical protein
LFESCAVRHSRDYRRFTTIFPRLFPSKRPMKSRGAASRPSTETPESEFSYTPTQVRPGTGRTEPWSRPDRRRIGRSRHRDVGRPAPGETATAPAVSAPGDAPGILVRSRVESLGGEEGSQGAALLSMCHVVGPAQRIGTATAYHGVWLGAADCHPPFLLGPAKRVGACTDSVTSVGVAVCVRSTAGRYANV